MNPKVLELIVQIIVNIENLELGSINRYLIVIHKYQVEEGQKEPLSYEERLFKKYGKYEKFDDYDKDYVLDAKSAVFSYDRTYFLDKN